MNKTLAANARQNATEAAVNAVGSLHDGGIDYWYAVKILLREAGLPHDDAAVDAAIKVRHTLALLDDDTL